MFCIAITKPALELAFILLFDNDRHGLQIRAIGFY